jgi:tetratricopeptide (TPR) repeat protein
VLFPFWPKAATLCGALLLVAALAVPSAGAKGNAAQPSCSAAATLRKSGRPAAAEAAYAKALENTTTKACAKKGLRALDEEHAVCARGDALARAGRSSEARSAYEEALKTKPGAKCAMQGIDQTNQGFFGDPAETSKSILAWLGLGTLLLGVGLAAVALLLLILTRLPILRHSWPARKIQPIRVGIGAFDDGPAASKQGAALAALVRTKLESFGAERAGLKMIDSQAAIEETLWTKFGAINDQAKTVSALVQAIGFLYPYRQFEASGILQSDTGSGPGISLSVRKRQELMGTATIWAETFKFSTDAGDQAQALQRMAAPIAAWISHVTATAAGEKAGGAEDPISWAMFKAGSEWESEEEYEKAAGLYRLAVELDSSNWGALAQLGALENDRREYALAIDHLGDALDVLQSRRLRTPPHRKDPDWYRVKYRLASTMANDAYENETSFRSAAEEIDVLLDACWHALEPWPWKRLSKRNRALRAFVGEKVEPAAINLKALIYLGLEGFEVGKPLHLNLHRVRCKLKRDEPVPPLTIVEALIADRKKNQKKPGPLFCFDLACFFKLGRMESRALEWIEAAWAAVPTSELAWYRAQVAADPMLCVLPDLSGATDAERPS